MTGCHAWKVGQQPGANIFANLTNNCATVMELLKDNGYLTCMVGRLDMVTVNWNDPAQLPTAADRYLGSPSGGPGNYYREASGTPWYKDGARYGRETGDYSTDLVTAFAADFIEGTAASDQPFFVYDSHYAPHWPLQADEEDIAPLRPLYERATRANLMQARLDGLIASGIVPAGTTLLASALNATANSKVPRSERLALNAAMVASIDQSVAAIMTALENAGKLDNTLIPLDGESMVSVLRDTVPPDEAPRVLVWPAAIRQGNWKLMVNAGELYDLTTDRNESTNIAAAHPDKVAELQQLHAEMYP